jgi:hypothetical protein
MTDARHTQNLLWHLAQLHPELWELVHPHVPFEAAAAIGATRRFDAVALNPQPLPPVEVLRLAVRSTARAVAEAAIAATVAGRDAREVLQEVGDDWCPTRPKHIPWPRRWPFPWPRDVKTGLDEERLTPAVQAEAGLVFQAYASNVADEGLAAAFGELAGRMVDAAGQERREG